MRILIARTDAMGDTILTMPMAERIKVQFPQSHITFLVSKISLDLFKNHPFIDEVIEFDKNQTWPSKLFKLIKIFKKYHFNHYIYVGGSHFPSFVSFFMRVSFRGGLKSRWPSFLWLNKGIRQKRSLVEGHELEYNLHLLESLGIEFKEGDGKRYFSGVTLEKNEEQESLEIFFKDLEQEKLPSHKELFFIHPGMTGHTLNWASLSYGRLIRKLEKKFPDRFLFVISHTPVDGPYLKNLKQYLSLEKCEHLKNCVYFFDGSKRGLRHYMGVLKHASFFIGPSTGTTHLANILGVRQIGLYSPIKVQSSHRWGTLYKRETSKIMVPDVVCGQYYNCAGSICPYFECMDKIEVADVIQKVSELLEIK